MSCETLFPWVGNKKFYLELVRSHLPKDWNREKDGYVEPFLGSGVVFHNIQPKYAILSDSSVHLMDIFFCMKSNPVKLYKEVKSLYDKNSKETHTETKQKVSEVKDPQKKSAMFWYLLKTSLYSFVCLKADGKSFTCCYKSTGKPIPMKDGLFWSMSMLLQEPTVYLYNEDFRKIIPLAKKGDFILIDPPYMNQKRPSRKIYDKFTKTDHERLVEAILQAHKKGCYIMMFNHNHPYLLDKLKEFNVINVEHKVLRKTRSHFATYEEVMFTNYSSYIDTN